MPDPEDFKSALDELEQAMLSARGESQVRPPLSSEAMKTPIQSPAPPDKAKEYRRRAEEDLPRVQSLRGKIEAAAKKHAIPVEYLEGIASRESRAGKALNPETGYDDVKQAYGIMQIDERFHKLEGTTSPDSQEHLDQAAGILYKNKQHMDKKFPKWSQEERWRAAIAAYNMGAGNVKTKENIDKGTTGNDYSQDVLIRSQIFKERLHPSRKKKR